MKFAALLRGCCEDLPELQCLFHIYKNMKKQLKKLPAKAEGDRTRLESGREPAIGEASGAEVAEAESNPAVDASAPARSVASVEEAAEEALFTASLTDHLQRLNDRFLEREEMCVIQLERLEAETAACSDAARALAQGGAAGVAPQLLREDGGAEATGEAAAGTTPQGHAGTDATPSTSSHATKPVAEQRAQLYKRLVNFHGEVLLLVHWSVLAYTATVKILKKHHKRTGLLLRAPQLADLLSHPFCSSELMTSLARKAEACIQRLTEHLGGSGTSGDADVDQLPAGQRGAGGPQDTVEQGGELGAVGRAAAVAATTAAAAAAMAGVERELEGSSPSCSQSLGDHAPGARAARRRATGESGGTGARGHKGGLRESTGLSGEGVQGSGNGGEGRGGEQQAAQGSGRWAGGETGAKGATAHNGAFLRSLARLSDNASAASLPDNHVLEQLQELQNIVDVYDNDEDDVSETDDDSSPDSGAAEGAGAGAQAGDAATRPAGGPAGQAGAGASAEGAPRQRTPVAGGSAAAGPAVQLRQQAAAATPRSASPEQQQQQQPANHQNEPMQLEHPPVQHPQGAGDAAAAGDAAVGVNGAKRPSDLATRADDGAGRQSTGHQPAPAGGGAPPMSSSGSAAAGGTAGASGGDKGASRGGATAGCCSAVGTEGTAVSLGDSVGPPLIHGLQPNANLLRRTQVALTMWEQLRTNASTPSTVIDPAVGPGSQAGPPNKRQRLAESVGDDSGSNSD